MTLNRLLNADNECVGYFTDDAPGRAAMQAARAEWVCRWYRGPDLPNEDLMAEAALAYAQRSYLHNLCRAIATPIKPLALEDVEPDDGDRVDYVFAHLDHRIGNPQQDVGDQITTWTQRGATLVEVQRYLINRYRRPGKSNRSADLGGPEQAAGVLYVLTIKAPK